MSAPTAPPVDGTPPGGPVLVTTSWDDGHVLDRRLGDLLERYGIAATFYVAPRSEEIPPGRRLSPRGLVELATRFEIGGHTLTHRRLPTLDPATARHEIRAGREELEQITGIPVRTFCYPGGRFRSEHVAMVRDEGFVLARTVQRFRTDLPADPLRAGTTVHAYRHLRDPGRVLRDGPRGAWRRFADWAELAIHQFDRVLATGGVFHLWGHSWELDRHGDWGRLERVLAHIARRPGVRYVTNAGVVAEHPSPGTGPRGVVQVVPYYPPHLGGTENVARTLAEELARDRPVTVLTSRSGARHVPAVERHGQLTVRRLRTVEAQHLPVMPGLLPALLRADAGAVVHVHVTQAYTPEVVWLAARLRRRAYVAHFHLDVDPSGPLGALHVAYKRWVLGPLLRGAARVIVLTEAQREQVRRLHRVDPARLAVVPNGVAERFFLDPRPRSEGPLALLFVGRLGEQKNVGRLLRAMAELRRPVHLDIVGDGEDRDDLERLRDELGLGDRVAFRGALDGDRLVSAYRAADAFVLASNKEGMPLAVLEAMAAGLPVVATDVPGLTEAVGEDGLLVAPEPAALAAAIDRLAADEDLRRRLAERSVTRAARSSWAAVLAALEQAYAGVPR